MATVTGFTASRMLEIENDAIVDGEVVGDNLILTTKDGTDINAGNVRGPAGTDGADAAPGSVAPTANTTPIRTSDGRVKTAPPTEADDAATTTYVDSWHNLQQIEIDAAEARLDALEGFGLVARMGSHIRTTPDGTLSASEVQVCTVTIPNPINGATYRITAHGNFAASASCEARFRIKHGLNAMTGGTQIAEACVNHLDTRAVQGFVMTEFTYTGTTGQANYNVVTTYVPLTATGRVSTPGTTRPAVLIVDRIV